MCRLLVLAFDIFSFLFDIHVPSAAEDRTCTRRQQGGGAGGVSDGAEQVTARSHDGIPVDIKRNEPK